LANLYLFLGAPEKIEQELKKCLEISAFNWEGYHRLSQLYWSQKEHQKAIQWLKQGLQLLPDNLNLIIDLADHYKAIQDYATAQQFYQSALELNSSITPVVAQFLNMQTHIEAQQRRKASPQPHPSTQRPDPQALLEALLNSEDLVAAIEMHRSEMDLNFIKVIEENRQAALTEGFQELAEGLEALIEYIGVVPGYE
jgi:tetratricopeptide (TPR) repeat protein